LSAPSRRSLLRAGSLLPLATLGGCAWLDDLFETDKPKLPGKREDVMASNRGLQVDPTFRTPVNLPLPVLNPDWPQSGYDAAHVEGNVQLGDLSRRWRRSIGEGGGYRRVITATPVIANGTVFTMDSDATVSAFDLASGERRWDRETQARKDRSTNVGGGLAFANGTVFATTGRAEALAIEAGGGKIIWRSGIETPARSAPTFADNKLFFTTVDNRLLALAPTDGKRVWTYQATNAATSVLGMPAPAFSDGLVVAGFGSGDLVCVRSDSGTIAWSDSLAASRGRTSLADLSAIRGLPVIADDVVYAISVGGLLVANDLRSGRRLWDRQAAGDHTPWLAGDWLFVLTDEQLLACLAKSDGRVRWTTPLPRFGNPEKSRDPLYWSGPLLGGKYLYCAGTTEKLIAINPATGDVLGEQELPDAVSLGLVAAGGKLLIVSEDGTLSALG
jgi:outer membrane protein assembly factor BamB